MTITEVLKAIETHFNTNWTTTSIAWPNVPFTAPNSSWVRFNILPDDIYTDELGPSGAGIRRGVVKIQVFTKPNIGSRTGAGLAAAIESLFHLKDIDGIHFESAYTTNNGLDAVGTWYQFTVTAPWWAWVDE